MDATFDLLRNHTGRSQAVQSAGAAQPERCQRRVDQRTLRRLRRLPPPPGPELPPHTLPAVRVPALPTRLQTRAAVTVRPV